MFQTLKGVRVAEGLKVTMIRNTEDPLLDNDGFAGDAEAQKDGRGHTLGANLVEDGDGKRIFAARQGHTLTFFRPSERRRIARIANTLEALAT
jgi:hypothetical protein